VETELFRRGRLSFQLELARRSPKGVGGQVRLVL